MEDIISKLAEIEAAASQIMGSVSDEKKRLAMEYEASISEFDRKVEADTEAKVQNIRANLEVKMKQELESQKSETQKTLAQMEAYYEAHGKELAKEIYNKIIRM